MNKRRFLLIIASVVLVLLAVVIWYYPSSEDFRTDNPFWNGLKTFTTQLDASSVTSLDSLPANPVDTTLVIIPQLEFTEPEMERIKNYLSLGGTVIIMDDFSYGNDILDYLGIDARFTQEPLLDPLFNYINKKFPRIIDFAKIPATENIESIVLNHATSLSGVPEANVIAWSSVFSFSDANDNSIPDDGESRASMPVVAAQKMGEGYLVLIADPSILINSMEGISDNHKFIENIFKIQYSSPTILLDQSHVPGANLDEAKSILAKIRSRLSSPLGISVVVAILLMLTLSPLWLKIKGLSPIRWFKKEE